MKALLYPLLVAAYTALVQPAAAQTAGTLTVALQQNVDINGRPLSGCLLNIYQAGTIASPEPIYTDQTLTTLLPNPLQCDTTGRIPMFYLGSTTVHIRLTDSGGVPIYDVQSMIVLSNAPTSGGGGGGGGGTIDPTTIASTGDIKFRSSLETLAGWVVLNGTSIGSASSGASQRANADTQNLYVYLWNNCIDNHCTVATGRGASGLADFNANKQIGLIDLRGRVLAGLDYMGTSPANVLDPSNIGSGDSVNTPNASGGLSIHTITLAEMPIHNHTISDPHHAHDVKYNTGTFSAGGNTAVTSLSSTGASTGPQAAITNGTGINVTNNAGSGGFFPKMPPFSIGSWYMKL